MESNPKALRRLLFVLGEVEQMLRVTGRAISADALTKLTAQSSSMPPDEFVGECRVALEAALLGERDMSSDLIGAILDAMENVDNLLRTDNTA